MKKKIAFFLIIVFVLTSGFGCKLQSAEVKQGLQPIEINYWRVWDGPDAFAEVFAEYNKLHPNIKINYKKFRYDEYEEALLQALAEDRGPDIFSIETDWVRRYEPKIAPMPKQISMVYPVTVGTIKPEVIPELQVTNSISLSSIKNGFIDTVYYDVVNDYTDETTKTTEKRVFGLPLSMDTLAMYYNKDLLNNANISVLSSDWTGLLEDIKKLKKNDARGDIIQAGVALGTGSNVNRAADIMVALMKQNGASIIDGTKVLFTQYDKDRALNPGLGGIKFYTDFANPAKDVYTWNSGMDNSLNMFMSGKLAIMFDYSYDLPTIRAQAPKLNFAVMPFPQIKGSTKTYNVANYWVESVSNKSKHINEAWDLIQFLTTIPENNQLYLNASKRPAALRVLNEKQKDDDDLGVFANQMLTAENWYRGNNSTVAAKALEEMADAIATGGDLEQESKIAVGKIQQTLR
jgi:multiple sugar transport system substrate-binding protein